MGYFFDDTTPVVRVHAEPEKIPPGNISVDLRFQI